MPPACRYQRDEDGYLPIEGYAAIGNGRTVALVGVDGSIDWCPFPRIDSPSVFARLLDAGNGGYWQIAPAGEWSATRHYIDDTNVLVTEFVTPGGVVEVTDLMPSIAFGADLGLSQELWDGMLLRCVRCVRGEVEMRMTLAPAFNYARDTSELELIPGRGAVVSGSGCALRVAGTLPLAAGDNCLSSAFTLCAGDRRYVSASFHGGAATVWLDVPPQLADSLVEREIEGWQRWIARCAYDGPYAEHVRRGALVLKLLDYLPSGAMVAAATTSLPEDIGGVRNWDYRYAWIRDSAYAIHALHSIGFSDEAVAFLQWVIDVTNANPSRLQIMYRVDGGQDLDEVELEHLEGYRGSGPVRIGNAANAQRQLDRFGEVVDAAFVHRSFGGVVNRALWDYIAEIVELVIERWRVTDSGIWEVRSEPRRMTFSNVMCWVALDRAIRLAEMDEFDAPLERWRAEREVMRDEIMRLGVSERGVFSQGFGDDFLDASSLTFPLRHFIDVDHPVMRRTVEAIDRELTTDGLVSRYLLQPEGENIDGLPGDEGRFVICSTWLIECLLALGERERARELLERLLERANDLLLFAEMIDPETGMHLGNFPQAFSHLGVIGAIVNYARVCGEVDTPHDHDVITGAVASGPETRRIVAGVPGE